jgi:hypothetical protein
LSKRDKRTSIINISAENEENPPLLMEVGDFNSGDVVESHLNFFI